jgi:D-alanyl-lipoteichoic acid acyltransferase DltB (MBOAT superfamily)
VVIFLASLFFIGYISPALIYFTLLFTIPNYFLGIIINNLEKGKKRKFFFWLGIYLNIGLLGFYKYINFFIENINAILGLIPDKPAIPLLSIIIPVGISYYTFQALGYLIRINRGAEKAEKNFGLFATFLVFFPKFLAGPVERSGHFLPQLNAKIKFDNEMISAGLRLILWGLFKKVVIADNMVGSVNLVYGNLGDYSGLPLILNLFIQTIYLYCDFSGYTDMAIGSAKVLGLNIIDNFNRPFFAKNVGDFWRRWHMSLSSWCNDFIFSPFIVKYRKMGTRAVIIGIFLTFFVIGIWHGANWTFVVLGILQGLAIIYEFYTKRWRLKMGSKFPPFIVDNFSRILTFIFFSISLVFFNAANIEDAWYYISHLFQPYEFTGKGMNLIINKTHFIIALVGFAFIMVVEFLQEAGKNLVVYFLDRPRILRWAGYYILIMLIYYYNSDQSTFVYLQF